MQDEIEKLRKEAHEAPMNKVYQDHKKHRFLGSHSIAWSDASRRLMQQMQQFQNYHNLEG